MTAERPDASPRLSPRVAMRPVAEALPAMSLAAALGKLAAMIESDDLDRSSKKRSVVVSPAQCSVRRQAGFYVLWPVCRIGGAWGGWDHYFERYEYARTKESCSLSRETQLTS